MSVLYKINPSAKILIVLIFTFLVFFVKVIPAVVFLTLSIFIFRIAAKIPFNGLKHLKNLSMLVTFLIILQTLFYPGTNFIVKPLFPPSFPLLGGLGSLKWEGLMMGLLVSCRLTALFLLLPILTITTPPQKLACGLCALGINYRISFIITMAFNLIPVFEEEAVSIMDAQKLRGARIFEKASIFGKLKAYPSLAVPLVLGAMRKAQLAGIAMDSRAFGVYKTRTWLDKPVFKKRDFLAISCSLVFCAAVLLLNYP